METIADNQERVVVIEIGAGTSIPSVRHFSHRISHELDGCIIRINPIASQVQNSRDIGLATGLLQALRDIDLAINYGCSGQARIRTRHLAVMHCTPR